MALVLLVAGGVAWWILSAEPAGQTQVQLETVSLAGPAPFTAPAGTDTEGVVAPANATGEQAGNTGGLYAQDPDQPACDAQALIAQLTADPAKAAAWAMPTGTTAAGIPAFVSSLTPTTLRADTAVTQYGYHSGQFQPYPAVLQAGTAVLVNSYGEPTVKCYNGNPLGRPTATNDVDRGASTFVGVPWAGFAAERTIRIAPTAAPVAALPVVNPGTNTQQPVPVPPDPRPDPGPNPGPPTGGDGQLMLTGRHNYDGTITLSDGRIIRPNGDPVPPRVEVTHPPGSTTLPDGAIRQPNGLVFNRDGTQRLPLTLTQNGITFVVNPDGSFTPPRTRLAIWNHDGTVTIVRPGSTVTEVVTFGQDGQQRTSTPVPPGSVVQPDGSIRDAAGNVTNPNGTSRQTTTLPGGGVLDQNGGNTPPRNAPPNPNAVPMNQPGPVQNAIAPDQPGQPGQQLAPGVPVDPGQGEQACAPGVTAPGCEAPAVVDPDAPVVEPGAPGGEQGAEPGAPAGGEGGAPAGGDGGTPPGGDGGGDGGAPAGGDGGADGGTN